MVTSRSRALWLTSRPKTLSAAVVPVMAATALVAGRGHHVTAWISVCALLSAMAIQIGTNFVNDALDFVKGADRETRLGEARASQQGWFTHRMVLGLGFGFFILAFLLGIPLVLQGGWPIVVVGLVSLAMGYAYTGGPFPLAYRGFGDLFVILFFGLVAVGGVYYLQTGEYGTAAAVMGLQIGCLATVLIAINNLRDLDQDKLVAKRTLAVRLGPRRGRLEVALLIAIAFGLSLYWWIHGYLLAFALPWVAFPLALRLIRAVWKTPASPVFNKFLAQAALVHMLFGVLLSLGFLFQ
jgi:1,4-dihydroxy-2-naphthoate octaprenyltransferase